MKLNISDKEYTIHRLEPGTGIPDVVLDSDIYFVGKTDEELSIVCDSGICLDSPKSVEGWSYMKIDGPLDFNLQGILSDISEVLAKNCISICAISTFDTDYIFVRSHDLRSAKTALEKAGYTF